MASQIIAAGNANAMYNHHIPIIPYDWSIRSPTIFIVFEVLSQSTEAGWVSKSTNTQRRMQLSFSLSHFHPLRLLLFSRFFRGQGTRTRGKRAMFSSSSHFLCTRNLEGCCFHLKARLRMGLKWSLQRPPTCTMYYYYHHYYIRYFQFRPLDVLTLTALLVRLLLDSDFCTHCTLLPNNSHSKIHANNLLVIMLGHANWVSGACLLTFETSEHYYRGWNGRGEYVKGWKSLSYIFIPIFVPKLYHCAR